jgi:predicted transcriptional regulator
MYVCVCVGIISKFDYKYLFLQPNKIKHFLFYIHYCVTTYLYIVRVVKHSTNSHTIKLSVNFTYL